ncbi:lipopolysaccharide assembly protein LapA domain-containing protein [Rheinheimera pleomorphica]|uniref:lipopolysaccharide assembly protein LapA domain-containing protein n=1 Tax=Rheinheimera pleomorphica TaxID=2703963 RepID=UPI0014239C89|nr:lipopolysaccharide assembly protein LapA domain-containing protein [Rheinheimera pleomorphica]
MRRLLFIVVLVALVIVGVLFGSINQQLADLHLLIVSVQLRVVDIALIFLLLGILLGLLIALLYAIQRKTKGWLRKSADRN